MNDKTVLNGTTFNAPYKNLVRPMTAGEYERTKKGIHERGVMVPILVDEFNNIIDGHHRLQICAELGIFPPIEIRSGLTDEEKHSVGV